MDSDDNGALRSALAAAQTRWQQAEMALRTSARAHRFLLDHVPAGVLVQARDGTVRSANAHACRLLGLDAAVAPSAQADRWRFTDRDGRYLEPHETPAARVVASGRTEAERVLGLQRANGLHAWLLVSAYPEFGDDATATAAAEVQQVVVTFVDVTERAEAEAARRDAQASRNALLEAMSDGVFVAQDHRFAFANAALPIMLGHAPRDFVGLRFDEVVDPAFLERWTERFDLRVSDEWAAHQPPGHYEVRLLRKDGAGTVWVDLRASRIEYGGRAAVLGIVRDIGERKRADAELRASEERWKFALEGAGDGVWDWDVPGDRVVLSRRFKELIGYAEDEPLPEVSGWRERIHPDDWAAVGESLRLHLSDGRRPFVAEHRLRHKDGRWRWVLGRGLVVARDAQGRALRMVGTLTDLEERKNAEAARDEMEVRLREAQKMEAIGTLAGGVAHDFNNVLAGILGNVALARQDLAVGHPARASVDQIRRAGLRARDLVQQILTFGRRQPQALVDQALAPLVQEALALLRATLPAGVSIDVRLSPVPLYIKADATQMQQVLMNLCTNAWHAMQGGSGRIEIGLDQAVFSAGDVPAGSPPVRYAHLSVADNGCGMDTATRARIFEPFYTTKPVGQGTGLGLAVVHGIIASHGGAISVDSQPGRGSVFHLHFPLVDAPTQPTEPVLATQHGELGGGQHVLYVDDDEIMVLTVERLLQRAGYTVTCFSQARQAMAALRERSEAFDLIITDFNMPELSGLDLAREALALRPERPVIISSGYISEDLRTQARRLGVRQLLHKEHTVEELSKLVHRVLCEDGAPTMW